MPPVPPLPAVAVFWAIKVLAKVVLPLPNVLSRRRCPRRRRRRARSPAARAGEWVEINLSRFGVPPGTAVAADAPLALLLLKVSVISLTVVLVTTTPLTVVLITCTPPPEPAPPGSRRYRRN